MAVLSACWGNTDYSCGSITIEKEIDGYTISCTADNAYRPGTHIVNSGYGGYNIGQMKCAWSCTALDHRGVRHPLKSEELVPGSLGNGVPCSGSGSND